MLKYVLEEFRPIVADQRHCTFHLSAVERRRSQNNVHVFAYRVYIRERRSYRRVKEKICLYHIYSCYSRTGRLSRQRRESGPGSQMRGSNAAEPHGRVE